MIVIEKDNNKQLYFNSQDLTEISKAGVWKLPPLILYIALALLTLAIFAADYNTQLGVAVWILYVIPITLSLLAWRPIVPVIVAVGVSVLMLVGYQPDQKIGNLVLAQINRTFGFSVIWIMAGVGFFFFRNKIKNSFFKIY